MSTPYYSDDLVTLYHGDALEVLPGMSADLAVTDPPYGISDAPLTGDEGGKRRSSNTWHPDSTWDTGILPQWPAEVAQAAPVIAWFGHWRKRLEVEESMPMPLRCEIVWAKNTHVGPPCPAAMRDERIWIFGTEGIKPTRFETTVWDSPVIPSWEFKHHKNEKPLALMTRLVSWLPGATVLDPFAGSGTTLLASRLLGRRSIGVELDERYCEIAAKRLAQGVLDFGASA